jgi:transmembrane sensor
MNVPGSPVPPDPAAEARLDREAADWLVRRDRGLTAAEQDAFFQWLAADPRHGEWFARHQRTWQEFNLLAQWRPEHSAEPNPDLLARPRRRTRWLVRAAPLAAAAAVVLGFFLRPAPPAEAPSAAPVAAATAGSRLLDDGSTVDLRGDSAITVAFSAGERRVELLRGEAFFTVAKDAARPFIVHANGVDVRAVGTAFNVRVDRRSVEVLVTEGRVQVAPPPTAAAPEPAAAPQLVAAGERAVVAIARVPEAPRVSPVSAADIARELAWQPRLLDFSSTPLAEVVAEFNARNRTQLVLGDTTLAGLPIVASVRSDNVEGFVRLLEATTDIRGERRGDTITLRRAP